jgi:glycosyltransferase involved in cell wall biosynthesis
MRNLHFSGWADSAQVQSMLRLAGVAVMPSKWEEPAGIAALEAMAVGTPIAAYRRGGFEEYVEGSGAGIVVDESPQSLAAAARRLLNDMELWHRCSGAGPRAIKALYSGRRVDEIVATYQDVAGARSGSPGSGYAE